MVGVEGILKPFLFHGQGHLLQEQIAASPVQPGLGHLHSFSGNPTSLITTPRPGLTLHHQWDTRASGQGEGHTSLRMVLDLDLDVGQGLRPGHPVPASAAQCHT